MLVKVDRVFSEHSTVEISGLDNVTGASVFYPSKVRWKSAFCVTLGDRAVTEPAFAPRALVRTELRSLRKADFLLR